VSDGTDFFPLFIEEDRKAAVQEEEQSRQKWIDQHLQSLRTCWPEWEGPRVGGWCSVNSTCAFSVTHGELRYHYCAPCRLLFQIDQWTWLAVIVYTGDTHCRCYTGELLRLDITDIWAPTDKLWAAYYAAQKKEAAA